MKFALLFAILSLLTTLTAAQAQSAPLRLEVRVDSEVDNKGAQNETKTQHRQLHMTVSSISPEPIKKVQMNWWFFARNMKSGNEAVLKKGSSKTITVGALGRETVTSDRVTSTYEDKHTEKVKSKGKGNGKKNNAPNVKTVPASGNKISGYAVQALVDGKIVAEHYSSASYQERLRSGSK